MFKKTNYKLRSYDINTKIDGKIILQNSNKFFKEIDDQILNVLINNIGDDKEKVSIVLDNLKYKYYFDDKFINFLEKIIKKLT